MPRHVLTLLAVNLLFFALLWVAIVLFDLSAMRAFVLVFLTMILVGAGVLYTVASVAGDRDQDGTPRPPGNR